MKQTTSTIFALLALALLATGCAQSDENLAGQALRPTPIASPYVDPTACKFQIFTPTDKYSTEVSCGSDSVIGMITHIDCPVWNDVPKIVGTSWLNGRMPDHLSYLCVGDGGVNAPPSQVFAYCCAIRNLDPAQTASAGTQVQQTQTDANGQTSMN